MGNSGHFAGAGKVSCDQSDATLSDHPIFKVVSVMGVGGCLCVQKIHCENKTKKTSPRPLPPLTPPPPPPKKKLLLIESFTAFIV